LEEKLLVNHEYSYISILNLQLAEYYGILVPLTSPDGVSTLQPSLLRHPAEINASSLSSSLTICQSWTVQSFRQAHGHL